MGQRGPGRQRSERKWGWQFGRERLRGSGTLSLVERSNTTRGMIPHTLVRNWWASPPPTAWRSHQCPDLTPVLILPFSRCANVGWLLRFSEAPFLHL